MLQRRIHCRNFALQHVAAPLSVLQRYVTVCCRATVVATTVCFIYCSDANCVYGIVYCDVLQRRHPRVSATVSSSWCAKRQIHVCGGAYLHVWHDSFMCVAWLVYMSDVMHSYV